MSRALALMLIPIALAAQTAATFVSHADATPMLETLRESLWPAEFRGRPVPDIERDWPSWVRQRDRAIRARVQEGEEDSVVYLLQFGTSFTTQPRIGEDQLAGVAMRAAGSAGTMFIPSPLLQARIEDFITAVRMPGANERLQLARRVLERRGLDVSTPAGRTRIREFLEGRTAVVGAAVHAPTLQDPSTPIEHQLTIFRERGLASDTLLWIGYAIEQTLAAMRDAGALSPGSVRRVAIVGPGLDITDKQEGYDFYPPQTIQPFALLDSLARLELGHPAGVQMTAFDLSPAVLQHLETARTRAAAGRPYTVVLPRNLDQPWTDGLIAYRDRFGAAIGGTGAPGSAPANAGRVDVRTVSLPPAVVQAIEPRDLNIVLQRVDETAFDLIVVTNVLLYYDVFEQSLAAANMAAMLRPGGFVLSNNRIFELPGGALVTAGSTEATYLKVPTGPRGDRVEWYRTTER